ncbi:MAG: undecaprenyl-diphosphatase [Rhodopseudomonas palustris]|uniref:Undecaprenyl-diphosphatase n=1 Tax=Rhodopseudomonas palustris TaxID=1076 RepID=A0A933S0A8_RHOPL|nr:undecaprenyl-diphosphatase [Rhodopseudomonas palustris]
MFQGVDDRLFFALAASSATNQRTLGAAIFIARWAISFGPLALAALWIFGSRIERRAAVLAGASALLAVTVAGAISSLWMHARPFVTFGLPNLLDHAPDSSFPSDHSTLLFALGFGLCILPSVAGRRAGLSAVALGVVVGWSRIFLAVHYPSDIAGAAAVAAASSCVMAVPAVRGVCNHLTLWGEHLFGWSIASGRGPS